MLSANQKIVLASAISSAIAVSANLVPIIGYEGPTIHFTVREAAGLVVFLGLLFCGLSALLILAVYALTSKLWKSRRPFDLLMSGLIILSLLLWGGSFQSLAWGSPNAWALVTFAFSGVLSLAFIRCFPTSHG